MPSSAPSAGRAFALAVHGALALELGRLAASGEAFEVLWQRPRRTGLKVALKVLGLGLVAAAGAGLSRGRRASAPG